MVGHVGVHSTSRRSRAWARVGHEVAARGALYDCMTEADALDVVYTLMAPEVHRILTVDRGLSADRYEQWLPAR